MKTLFACEVFLICDLLISATSSVAQADLITFFREGDFNDPLIEERASGSILRQGLTATFTANVKVLNNSGSSFGINGPSSDDEPDLLDTLNQGTSNEAVEFITITFSQPVEFMQLTLKEFSLGETAKLTVGLNQTETLTSPSNGTHIYNYTSDSFLKGNLLALGQSLIIGSGTGNGFSLEGFAVNTVPEPIAFTLSTLAMTGLMLRRRRRPSYAH